MVKVLLGKDNTGVTKLLITNAGDPKNPNQAGVLFDSDRSTVRLIQSGQAQLLAGGGSVPVFPGGSPGHAGYDSGDIPFGPALPIPPMVLATMTRSGDQVYYTAGPSSPSGTGGTPASFGYRNVGPSIGWATTSGLPTGSMRLGHFFSYFASTTAVKFNGYSPRGGNPSAPYVVTYALLDPT